jgi:hypothetical protein
MLSIKFFSLFLIMTSNVLAVLPELQTKQALNNIRFLTNDGKFTYYQQHSGELQLSTNYSNAFVLKSQKGTSYNIFGSQSRKNLIIEVRKSFHKNLNFFEPNDLYIIKFGETTPTKIGIGTAAKLSIKDTWVTYFSTQTQELTAKNTLNLKRSHTIKLKNKINPYFIPQSAMATQDTVFYTDLNDKGYMALIMYSFIEKKFTTVFKSNFPGMRLDFCIQNEKIILGEFSYDSLNRGSNILKIPLYDNPNFKKLDTIYTSELDDIGNLTCTKDNIYFVKTVDYNQKINSKKTEIARISLKKDNKLKIITDLNYVTNVINMDGTILVPFRNKYYVIKGQSVLNKDDLGNNKE